MSTYVKETAELILVFLATCFITMGSCVSQHSKGAGCGRATVEAKAQP